MPIWPPRENCCWKWVQPNETIEVSCEKGKGAHPWPPGPLGCRLGGPCQPNGQLLWRPNEKNLSPGRTSRSCLGTSANFYVLVTSASVALGRPRRVDRHPKHFHTVCLGGTHPYHVLGPLTKPLRHSWGPQKGPFWPFWVPQRSLGSPGGPDLGPSATGWSNWVGRI